LQKIVNKNGVLSSAMAALSRTVIKVESGPMAEVDIRDAIMLQECASVIARFTTGEVLSAIKGMQSVKQA
jgi:hypothetical protein